MRFFGSRRIGRRTGRPSDPRDAAVRGRAPALAIEDQGARDVLDVLLWRVTGAARGGRRSRAGDGLVPAPLSRDRVVAWLAASGFAYFVDSDGDLGGLWHGRLFYFLVLGERDEVVQVHAQWNREATIERVEELLDACNAWNADHLWPKAYVRVRDDGSVVVCADVTVDVEQGVTDGQLSRLLQCGLSTASMFFDSLEAEYPDPLQAAP